MSNTAELATDDLEKTTAAARQVLSNGWYLFPCVPKDKSPYKGSNGKDGARNNASAMQKWVDGEAANPAIALKASGLVVLDIDSGIVTTEHALDFAKRVLGVETMVVKTTRGFHFYFSGSRELLETKYKNGNVSGDIKCNGHVMAAGAIHPSGGTYEVVNPNVLPAPLPKALRDYTTEKKPKKVPAKKTSSSGIEYEKSVFTEPTYTDRKIPAGRRYEFLFGKAKTLRRMGCEVAGVLAALKDICITRCEGGEAYVRLKDEKLRSLAEFACNIPLWPVRLAASPRPEPEMQCRIREAMSTMSTKVPVTSVGLPLVDINAVPRQTLERYLKALGIKSYKQDGVQYWEAAKQAKPPQSPVHGNNQPLTHNTVGEQMVDQVVDTIVTRHIPQASKVASQKRVRDKEYLREAKQKSRAKAKQSQGGAL